MKIGILVEHLDPARGGLEVWALRFAAWLAAQGHEVHALAFDARAVPAGVQYHPVSPGATREANGSAFARVANGLALDSLHDLGVGVGADVLHPQYGSRVACAEAEFRALPAWTQWRKRVSPFYRRRLRALAQFERLQIGAVRGVLIAPSKFAAEPLRERFGLRAEALRVVYNGVDPERFRREALAPLRRAAREAWDLAEDDVAFLEVAVNFRLKGVATALRALRRLPRQARLMVVGARDPAADFGRVDAFTTEARRLGVSDRVRFVGGLADVRPAFAAADAYVHPSWHDACSLSVMEAWASGLPVITSRCNGASELMTPGEEGFVLQDPGSDAGLAESMGHLLNPATRARCAEPARALAARNRFERQFAALLAIHEERLAARGPVGAAALRTAEEPT